MILVYPMLTSDTVNQQLLPGLIKAVEKYILIYNTDDILKHMNSAISDIVRTGVTGAVAATAGLAVAAAAAKVSSKLRVKGKKFELTEQVPVPVKTKMNQLGITPKNVQAVGKGAQKSIATTDVTKIGITGFELPRYDSVSLEPTWVQVHTSLGAKLLGVKVIPFRVKSTKGMVSLLMSDKEVKKMQYLANKTSRTAIRVLFRAMRAIKIPGIKEKPISGNAKTDIIWATSQYGKNNFVCFSKLDIEESDFLSSPQKVQRLHKLGWASLVVTDDINKQATFCMRQFGGVCSTIPYSFIFSSLGKEHNQVYKDLEEAQRSAGPFFRKSSTTKRKLFTSKE